MAANLILFLICLSTLVTPVWLQDGLHPSILKIFNAFVKLINFYRENYRDINLDGLFGLRVLEGNLMELVKFHREKKHSLNIPEAIIGQLATLSTEAGIIANLSILYLEKHDTKYFHAMGRVVSQPWTVFKNYRHIEDHYKWDTVEAWPDYGEKLDWKQSDICLSSMLSLDIPDNSKCEISDECLDLFLSRNVHSYHLSQQVFFLIMMEELGCKNTVEDYIQRNGQQLKSEDVETDFCTNCYYDILSIEPELKHNIEHQSLFLVNKFYCGSLGFVEFMKDEWLDIVLSWQRFSGCFTSETVEDKVPEIDKNDKLSRKKADYLRPDETQPVPQDNIASQGKNSKRIIRPQKNNIKQKKRIQTNQNSIQEEENVDVQNINNKNKNNDQDMEEKFTDENYANQVPQQRQRREAIINSLEEYEIESLVNRKLLAEGKLKGGCSSHKTAMAIGTLTMYIRYLIDPPGQYQIGEGRQKNDYFKPDEIAEQLSTAPIEDAPKYIAKPKLQTSPPAKKSDVSVESVNEELLTNNSLLSFKNSSNTTTIVTIIIVVCIIFFCIVIKCARNRTFGARGKHR